MPAAVRTFAPKPGDPGSVLVWTAGDGAEQIGEVWGDAPQHGTRWVLADSGELALVKVTRSGPRAGQVTALRTHPADWQRRVVRMLDRLAGKVVTTSSEQEWVPQTYMRNGGYERHWTRYHLAGCPDETDGRSPVKRSDPRKGAGWLLDEIAGRGGVDHLDLHTCITGAALSAAA